MGPDCRHLDAYLDDELGVETTLAVQAHLEDCKRCQRQAAARASLRAALQRTLSPGAVPSDAFIGRLRQALRRADPGAGRRRRTRTLAFASSVLVAAAALLLGVRPGLPGKDAAVTGEVVAAHLRSLQAAHLTDVASSDTHTVKPWFSGKLPFSLPVRDLRAVGFALQGGRLDYVAGQPVAALVYFSRAHAINVLVWPQQDAAASPPLLQTRAGLNILHWTRDGMAWWAVSDVNARELQRLAEYLQEPEKP